MEKLIFYERDNQLRLLITTKDGPYYMFEIKPNFSKIYKSGANYQEIVVLKKDNRVALLAKTAAGIFVIKVDTESQEAALLIEDQPLHTVPSPSNDFIVFV